jgi:APA family basic amino acid/polyamine antiporter
VLALRRDRLRHRHFRAPTAIPVIGAAVSIAVMTAKEADIFARAGVLLLFGVVLWAGNWWLHGRHVDPFDTGQIRRISAT